MKQLLRIICVTCFVQMLYPKELPEQIEAILKNDVFDLSSFIQAFNLQERFYLDEKISQERNFGQKVVVLGDECCKPRPVVVEIQQPNDISSFYYPYFVTLHRCAGSCHQNPFRTTCVASVSEAVKIQVGDISWLRQANGVQVLPQVAHLSYVNETQCSCKCRYDERVCSHFQEWDETSCKCKCNKKCPENYIYDPDTCCRCPESKVCARKQIWNWKTCQCECKKMNKPCKVQPKVRDPATCRCRCPFIYCRYGSELNEKTCRCQDRNFK